MDFLSDGQIPLTGLRVETQLMPISCYLVYAKLNSKAACMTKQAGAQTRLRSESLLLLMLIPFFFFDLEPR